LILKNPITRVSVTCHWAPGGWCLGHQPSLEVRVTAVKDSRHRHDQVCLRTFAGDEQSAIHIITIHTSDTDRRCLRKHTEPSDVASQSVIPPSIPINILQIRDEVEFPRFLSPSLLSPIISTTHIQMSGTEKGGNVRESSFLFPDWNRVSSSGID
jgi:hypothetical protein